MLAVRGADSTIVTALATILADAITAIMRGDRMPDDADRYLFCAGLLWQKPASEQTETEIRRSWAVNADAVTDECDRLIEANDTARICVIGSEAAFTGSHDGTYADAKRHLHEYVEAKRLRTPEQQLICIAPSVIADTGMTNARDDAGKAALEERLLTHPKRRMMQPIEVAQLIHYVLYVDEGYLSGVVIRMNGGEHTA